MKQTISHHGRCTSYRTGHRRNVGPHRLECRRPRAPRDGGGRCVVRCADCRHRCTAWRYGRPRGGGRSGRGVRIALAQAGRIDALVNNAAVRASPLADATAADFDHQWRVNALAPMMLTQRLADHLKRRDAVGCAVNLLDQRITQPDAMAVLYLVSKKALEAYTLLCGVGFARPWSTQWRPAPFCC